MGRKFKLCHTCKSLIEYDGQARAWYCPHCDAYDTGSLYKRVSQTGVGIRWGRGFEDRDWLYTSGMRDYLDHREAKQGNIKVRVRERG